MGKGMEGKKGERQGGRTAGKEEGRQASKH